MATVSYKKLKSARVLMDNSADTDAAYAISAIVNIGDSSNVESVEQGEVTLDGSTVASFNIYNSNQSNYNYFGLGSEAQAAVLTAVNSFLSAVCELVASEAVVSLAE